MVYSLIVPSSVDLMSGSTRIKSVPTGPKGGFIVSLPTVHPGARNYYVSIPSQNLRTPATRLTVKATLRLTSRPARASDVRYSYRSGCPVGPSKLRVFTFHYLDWNADVKVGNVVARSDQGTIVQDVFGSALRNSYTFKQVRTADAFRGDDPAMMRADNTSAFNCRHVTGNPYAMSPHSYGYAYDINTLENPYQDASGRWWPSDIGQGYRNRATAYKGMLYLNSAVTQAFLRRGVGWGAGWSYPDYQHFDPSAPKSGFTGYKKAPRYNARVVR